MTSCQHFRRVPIGLEDERCITCGNDGPAFTGEARRARDRRNAAVDDLFARAERCHRWSRRVRPYAPRLADWLHEEYAELHFQAVDAELEPVDAWEGRTGLRIMADAVREVRDSFREGVR